MSGENNSADHYGATILALTTSADQPLELISGAIPDQTKQTKTLKNTEQRTPDWSDEEILCTNVQSSPDTSVSLNDFLPQLKTESLRETSSKQHDIDESNVQHDDLSSTFENLDKNDKSNNDTSLSQHNYDYTDDEGKTKETLESESNDIHGQTGDFSDGYFDQSIEKIYDRYSKSKVGSSENTDSIEQAGCFDNTRDIDEQNEEPFYKRCFQKKYIVLSTTALSMILALTTAIILAVNVFHVTDTHHHHGNHFHGDVDKNAEVTAEMYQKASIASDSANCSRIGTEILQQNGSAVDAAITTCFCIGVTNQYSSGIGGGGYMLIYIRENRTFEAIDFREAAPGRIRSDAYDKDYNSSRYGGMAIGVPGEVKGLYTAWKKYGRLPWKDLVQPAIDLARFGVPASSALINIINTMNGPIQNDPGLSKLYLDKNSDPIEAGTIVIDNELADTLTVIRDKPNDFYAGDLGAKIVNDVKEAGGKISFDDLQDYKALNREVVHSTIENFEVHTMGAPSGGPVVIAMLNILKGYNLKREDITDKSKAPLTYHRIIEAMKFAFGQKSREGDPDYNAEYEKALIANMTSEELGSKYRRMINDTSTLDVKKYYGNDMYQSPNESGTSHISVIAENGDAVALSSSINEWFGSTNRSSTTGIIYNNQMNDFSIADPDNPPIGPIPPMNDVHSGKRPTSSMSPMILTDNVGDVKFIIGGVGGRRIIPSVAQVLMNKVWFGDDLGEAVSRPRVYNFLQPPTTYVEGEGLESILSYLKQCNQSYEIVNARNFAAVDAIYVEKKSMIYAKADRRKPSGHSAGY